MALGGCIFQIKLEFLGHGFEISLLSLKFPHLYLIFLCQTFTQSNFGIVLFCCTFQVLVPGTWLFFLRAVLKGSPPLRLPMPPLQSIQFCAGVPLGLSRAWSRCWNKYCRDLLFLMSVFCNIFPWYMVYTSFIILHPPHIHAIFFSSFPHYTTCMLNVWANKVMVWILLIVSWHSWKWCVAYSFCIMFYPLIYKWYPRSIKWWPLLHSYFHCPISTIHLVYIENTWVYQVTPCGWGP